MGRMLCTLLTAIGATLISACASLPSLEGRSTTTAFVDTVGTPLGRVLAPQSAANPGKTGIYPLSDPHDAFAARLQLAAAAEKSLDVQYFVWDDDQTGYLLLEALWQAAKRGVRVRLLLDDFYAGDVYRALAVLDAQPNIEVRLYNPLVPRGARKLNLLTDFTRVNRRMHNKSFTVDNQVSIVGGRNVGNVYFGAGSGVAFADLDVVAVGPAVAQVSTQFDLYWNSPSAYPAASLGAPDRSDSTAALQAKFAATRADPESSAFLQGVEENSVVRDLLDRRLAFEWVDAQLFYDNPAKTLDSGAGTDILLFPQLVRSMGPAEASLDLVSPYFVPAETGTAALAALAKRGIRVRILTNSLAASDVKFVHAGYAKRRLELLRAGVTLYELKPTAVAESHEHDLPWFGSGSLSALHAKTVAVDRRRGFVGSFNFDPRSELLNTEMGLVIDSPALAGRVAQTFDEFVPRVAYEVRLAPDGQGLVWIERTGSGEIRYDTEPETHGFLRLGIELLQLLPIDWLL